MALKHRLLTGAGNAALVLAGNYAAGIQPHQIRSCEAHDEIVVEALRTGQSITGVAQRAYDALSGALAISQA